MTVGMVARCILSVPFVVLADNFTPDHTVIYKEVSGVELKLHVFEPEGSKASELRPAIIFFFGGGWAGVIRNNSTNRPAPYPIWEWRALV